jgi:hypothetical protein
MLDFLGIGAQKAGTTWLYEMLRLHPDIAFPAGKEVHFWDRRHSCGIDWYKSLFYPKDSRSAKTGEITPAYAILPEVKIRECREHFPDLKLIYLIRNPIERAWSSAKMALKRAEMEIHEASDQWFIDHFHSQGSMVRGDYESCLRNWYATYPKDQLLVCLFDELQQDPASLLRRCFQHVGVIEGNYAWPADLDTKVFPTADHALPQKLRAALYSIYEDKIVSLANFLGRDLSHWR